MMHDPSKNTRARRAGFRAGQVLALILVISLALGAMLAVKILSGASWPEYGLGVVLAAFWVTVGLVATKNRM